MVQIVLVSPLQRLQSISDWCHWGALYMCRATSDSQGPPLLDQWYMPGHNLTRACKDKSMAKGWERTHH